MLKLILLVPAAALLVFAGEGIYHAARGRQPVALTCEQFVAGRLPSPRVAVAGCEVNYAGAGYRESGGQVEELFLPARPAGGRGVPAPIVIATRDPGAIALARSVLGAGRVTTSEQSLEIMRRVADQLRLSTSIDGLVRTGIIERLRSQRILSGLAPPIAENAVIVDLHGTPNFVRPGIALGLGALLAGLAFWPLQREPAAARPGGGSTTPPGLPPPVLPAELASGQFDPDLAFEELPGPRHAPAVRPGAGPAVVPVSLPRLLLLALDVSAGPEAIETAPPLGSHDEVVAILRGVIPDLVVDHLHAVLARPDGSVRIALGPDDPVPTAVLEARGEAGVALVKEVLLMTGWRAFAPKTGLFVSAGDLEALAALAAKGPVG
jgi:hypothetical protein